MDEKSLVIIFSIGIAILAFIIFVIIFVLIPTSLISFFSKKILLKQAMSYMKNNKPKEYMENDCCILKLCNDDEQMFIKVLDKITSKYCDIIGDNNQLSSLWVILQMDFSDNTTFYSTCIQAEQYSKLKIQYH